MVYSQRLWAQDVYQVPPDSCGGRPAVNCVSDSLLLLLIVSISVPAEGWDRYRQTQAIDLRLVPDRPGGAGGTRWERRPGGGFTLAVVWQLMELLVGTTFRRAHTLTLINETSAKL